MKKNNSILSWAIIGTILVVLITWSLIKFQAKEGWLGYWGGILGSSIGVIGAVIVLKEQIKYDRDSLEKQLENEREQNTKQQVDNPFFNLLSMHNNQITNLKEQNIFMEIQNSFRENLDINMKAEAEEFLIKNFVLVKKALQPVKVAYEEYLKTHEKDLNEDHKKIYEEKWKRKHESISVRGVIGTEELYIYSSMARATQKIVKIEQIFTAESIKDQGNMDYFFKHTEQNLKELKIEIPNYFKKLIDHMDRYYRSNDYSCLSSSYRKRAVENALSPYYSSIGSYFRLVHRITKYINDNVSDENIKNNYFGFLRANMNQEEMLTIFYNAAYTVRGEGLLYELQKTNFFGNEDDIERDQHFDKSALFWDKEDVTIMLNKTI